MTTMELQDMTDNFKKGCGASIALGFIVLAVAIAAIVFLVCQF